MTNKDKKYYYGYILLPIATVFSPLTSILGILYSFAKYAWKRNLMLLIYIFGRLFYLMAHSMDQFTNVACQDYLNDYWSKTKDAYQYGNGDETISAVLGYNLALGENTERADKWAERLNRWDRWHCELSALSEILKIKLKARELDAILEDDPDWFYNKIQEHYKSRNDVKEILARKL